MRIFYIIFLLAFGLLSLESVSLAKPGKPCPPRRILQGVKGKLVYSTGNMMPGPGVGKKSVSVNNNGGKSVSAVRIIYFFRPVTAADMGRKGEGTFYKKPFKMKPMGKTRSCPDGHYSLALPPGVYSVFVKEKGGLWANSQNGEGILAPLTIVSGKVTDMNIDVNYAAVY
jgi:hypothetical protein